MSQHEFLQFGSIMDSVPVMSVENSQLHHATAFPIQYAIYLWRPTTISDRTTINRLSTATLCVFPSTASRRYK